MVPANLSHLQPCLLRVNATLDKNVNNELHVVEHGEHEQFSVAWLTDEHALMCLRPVYQLHEHVSVSVYVLVMFKNATSTRLKCATMEKVWMQWVHNSSGGASSSDFSVPSSHSVALQVEPNTCVLLSTCDAVTTETNNGAQLLSQHGTCWCLQWNEL